MEQQIITNQHLQDSFLYLAITDTEFCNLVSGQVLPKFFSSSITEDCVELCLNYFARYKQAPKDHFHDEIVHHIQDYSDEEKEAYANYIIYIQKMSPNKPYVLRRINDFVKAREYEEAALDFADMVSEGKFDEAQDRMYHALKVGIEKEEVGLRYFTDISNLNERGHTPEYLMGTGLAALDKKIGGFRRGYLVVYLGGNKAGKTWALMHVAKTALEKGLKVLHISHEVSLEEMETRYDMMLGVCGDRNIGQYIEYFDYNEKNNELEKIRARVHSVFDKNAIRKTRKVVRRFGGDLIIKKYPPGLCSTFEINRYLSYLERFENFVPDVLINDYADIMMLPSPKDQLRHRINQVYIWMKGLADERNILVVTASQVNRQALQKEYVSQKDIAEDIRKIANVDAALAICQTESMEKMGIARMAVIAGRSVPQNIYCSFSMCLGIGQFAISSWDSDIINKNAMDMYGKDVGEESHYGDEEE